MARTLAACTLPALAIAVAWLRIEDPVLARDALAVIALALAPALVPRVAARWLAAVAASAAAAWVAFGTETWELLPGRDERELGPLAETVRLGLGDFYRVVLPFDPAASPEMHALMLAAMFGFVLATALLVAAERPVAAAAVVVVGAGWPATLLGGDAVLLGALALGGALSIPLVLRVRTGRALLAGAVAAGLVVVGAAWASSATTIAREAALDWESWDPYGGGIRQAAGVQIAWSANYDGIRFPRTETVVLTVEGPDSARYWRTSTLDFFTDDHWFESLIWGSGVEDDGVIRIAADALTPPQALDPDNWLEQRVEVRALVDDRLAAAGTPMALDARGLDTVFPLSGGVLRVNKPLGDGEGYRVWSYAPDPAPAALARSRPVYPSHALPYLELGSRPLPPFGTPGRLAGVAELLRDPEYADYQPYGRVFAAARRVAGDARTPYAAVLALEAWFRQRGGFRYDEQPPESIGPPLVDFVTRTKSGYCQHYAGAMTLMLRMLGIPSRIAVGFTSGKYEDEKWVVTNRDAHAWVEVWFAGQGWVPFDPTPGRGTFGGSYSFASDSQEAIEALGRGELSRRPFRDEVLPDAADLSAGAASRERRTPSLLAVVLGGGAVWVAGIGLAKALLRRVRYLSRDPRRRATASRRELEAYLRDQGIDVPPGATLDDLRLTVGEELGVDARAFADAAGRARFGRSGDVEYAAERAQTELRGVLRQARSELSVWSRLRGLVSLRSLRGGWQT
jgi:protein-glutamine gamma-glutamyltransferase